MKLIIKRTLLLILGILLSFLIGYYNAAVGVIFIVLLLMIIIFFTNNNKDYFHTIHYRSLNDFFKNVHLYHYSSFFIYSPFILLFYYLYSNFNSFYIWLTILTIILYLFILTLAYFSEDKIKFIEDFLIIGSMTKIYSNISYDEIKSFRIDKDDIIIKTDSKIKLRNFTKHQLKEVKSILLSKGVKEKK